MSLFFSKQKRVLLSVTLSNSSSGVYFKYTSNILEVYSDSIFEV